MKQRFGFDRVGAIRRGERLFEDLSFTLAPGDAAVVSGANGAGKSTLLRIAAGLLPPSAGRVARDGIATALLAETAALDLDRALGDALLFWAALDDRVDPSGRVEGALAAIDLGHLARVPVRLLSTGQRRRAALARVIASGTVLWLLDEPASGLDEAALARLDSIIARHRDAGGMAIVATHQPIGIADAQAIRLGAA